MKRIIALFCSLILLVSFLISGCSKKEEITLHVETSQITVFIGEKANIIVESNRMEDLNFSSNNMAIAEVNNVGEIVGISSGQTEIIVSVRDMSKSVIVIVKEKEAEEQLPQAVVEGNDVIYSFEIENDGLYEFRVKTENIKKVSDLDDGIVYSFDNGYETRLKSRSVKSKGEIVIGTKYLKADEHTFKITNGADILANTQLKIEKTLSYNAEGLSRGKQWMNVLYRETGYNTTKKNYVGYVETEGWEDIWTHCQYLPYSMYIAKTENNAEYNRRVIKIADELLIGKMLNEDGSVNTIYRADSDVFQVSIEADMPIDKYELWRGQAAFIEEMINCYLYTGEKNYLDYAKKAANYIINNWTKTNVNGITEGIYTRYTSSAGGSIDIMSTGRVVMVFAQLYYITQDASYLFAAQQQSKALLKAQEAYYEDLDGLFADSINANGKLGEFRHGNAYANAMLGLAWMYKITEEDTYLAAIDKGVNVLKKVYDDEKGMIIVLDGNLLYQNSSTGLMYLAGRMAQAVMTCAAFVGDEAYYREGERIIEFALGRNYANVNAQNTRGGYVYSVDYYFDHYTMSNVETSCEIYLALIQYYYLSEIWGFDLK